MAGYKGLVRGDHPSVVDWQTIQWDVSRARTIKDDRDKVNTNGE